MICFGLFIVVVFFVFNSGKNQLSRFPETVGGQGVWFENHAVGCGPSEVALGSGSKGENGSQRSALEPAPSAFCPWLSRRPSQFCSPGPLTKSPKYPQALMKP